MYMDTNKSHKLWITYPARVFTLQSRFAMAIYVCVIIQPIRQQNVADSYVNFHVVEVGTNVKTY